jgi:hypothetical protein
VLNELVGQPASEPDYAAFLACVHHALGTLQWRSDRLDDAVVSYRNAVSVQTDLVTRFPENVSYNVVLGWLEQPLADALRKQGEWNQAQRLLEHSRDILERQLGENAELVYLHGLIAQSYVRLADVLQELGDQAMADEASRRADGHRQQMHPAPPAARAPKHDFGRGKPPHLGPDVLPDAMAPFAP